MFELEICRDSGFRSSQAVSFVVALTAPIIPTMGSTDDQMETETKFPRDVVSARFNQLRRKSYM